MLAVSAVTGEGMDALAALLKPGETAVLVGSSGVGKSTLVNALAGETLMATAAIREDDAHGRHTTTHRELIRLPVRRADPGHARHARARPDGRRRGPLATFEDIEELAEACRFSDCRHGNEPGCAVRAALESGELDPGRWKSFLKLQKELAFQARKEDPHLREAHNRRWVAVARANRARTKARGKP